MAIEARETKGWHNNSLSIIIAVILIALAAFCYLVFFQDNATGTTIDVNETGVVVEQVPPVS